MWRGDINIVCGGGVIAVFVEECNISLCGVRCNTRVCGVGIMLVFLDGGKQSVWRG